MKHRSIGCDSSQVAGDAFRPGIDGFPVTVIAFMGTNSFQHHSFSERQFVVIEPRPPSPSVELLGPTLMSKNIKGWACPFHRYRCLFARFGKPVVTGNHSIVRLPAFCVIKDVIIADSVCNVTQRETSIDDRCHFAGFKQLFHKNQILLVGFAHQVTHFLTAVPYVRYTIAFMCVSSFFCIQSSVAKEEAWRQER